MFRRRISLTRTVEMFMFGNCAQSTFAQRLSCMVASRSCHS